VYVFGVLPVFARNVAVAETDPDVHVWEAGEKLTLDEVNLQVTASDTLADRLTVPPPDGRYVGVAVNAEMDGGGVGATVTFTVVVTLPPPLTLSLNWYTFAVVLGFAWTVAVCETEPGEQGTAAVGSPETPLGAVNKHDVTVPPTVADSVTGPPDAGSVVGDAVNPVTVGAADAWSTTSKNSNDARMRHSLKEALGRRDMDPPCRRLRVDPTRVRVTVRHLFTPCQCAVSIR